MVNFPTIKKDIIDAVFNMPKVCCPISHYFADGIYIREMMIPAGVVAIGHKHKGEHLCTLLSGMAAFYREDGLPERIIGPVTFLAQGGHKIVYAITDIKVQNCYPNPDNIKDQDKIEEMYIEKTGRLTNDIHGLLENNYGNPSVDFNVKTAMDLPYGFESVLTFRKSSIHGTGVFVTCPFAPGEYIAPFEINGIKTTLAKYINHSDNSNCKVFDIAKGEKVLLAKKPIWGAIGDSKGQELTINYEELPS